MGKIRVNTIGDESLEQKQKEEAQKRQEAKKSAKIKVDDASETPIISQEEAKTDKKSAKKMQNKAVAAKKRSSRYAASAKLREKTKTYSLKEALAALSQMQKAKFDETVELHINTIEKGVSGQVVLPHGTGKQTRVAIISPAKDPKAADELVKKIEAGKIEFDVLVATPDAMPKLAKVARILGPKGLMPNPKAGTVTLKPEEVAKKYAGGQIVFKTEPKAAVIHIAVGKVSFGESKLTENITTLMGAIESEKVKNVYLKSTMSPSFKVTL